jgi:Skp family chaperone for outer membrane proteins
MQTIQLDVLNPEEAAEKHASTMAANDRRERERVAAKNRAAGHAKPEPGDRLYVTTMRGIKRRGRAGIRFVEEARTELFVVDNDPDKRAAVPSGATPVTVDGAEAILHDDALNVSARPATDAEAADLRSQLADRDSELADAKKEIERLRAQARQAAPMDPQGGPARLRAADRATRKVSDPDGFGGKD